MKKTQITPGAIAALFFCFAPCMGASSALQKSLQKPLTVATDYKDRYASIIQCLQQMAYTEDAQQKKQVKEKCLNELIDLKKDLHLVVTSLERYGKASAVYTESFSPLMKLVDQKIIGISLCSDHSLEEATRHTSDIIGLCSLQSELYASYRQALPVKYKDCFLSIERAFDLYRNNYSGHQKEAMIFFLHVCSYQLTAVSSLLKQDNRQSATGIVSVYKKINDLAHKINGVKNAIDTIDDLEHLKFCCSTIKKLFDELSVLIQKKTVCNSVIPEKTSYALRSTLAQFQESQKQIFSQDSSSAVAAHESADMQYEQKHSVLGSLKLAQADMCNQAAGALYAVSSTAHTIKAASQHARSIVNQAEESPESLDTLFDMSGVPTSARTALAFMQWCIAHKNNPVGYLGTSFVRALMPGMIVPELEASIAQGGGLLENLERRLAVKLFDALNHHKRSIFQIVQGGEKASVFKTLDTVIIRSFSAACSLEKRSKALVASTLKPESLPFFLHEISLAAEQKPAPEGSFLALFYEVVKEESLADNAEERKPSEHLLNVASYALAQRKSSLEELGFNHLESTALLQKYTSWTTELKDEYRNLITAADYQHTQLRSLGAPSQPLRRLNETGRAEKISWDYWIKKHTESAVQKKCDQALILQNTLLEEEKSVLQKEAELLDVAKKNPKSWWSYLFFWRENVDAQLELIQQKKIWLKNKPTEEEIADLTLDIDSVDRVLGSYNILSYYLCYKNVRFLKNQSAQKKEQLALYRKKLDVHNLVAEGALYAKLEQKLPARADIQPKYKPFFDNMEKKAEEKKFFE